MKKFLFFLLVLNISSNHFILARISPLKRSLFRSCGPINYLDQTSLANTATIQKSLIMRDGFHKVFFPASDGIMICGLLRTHPNAQYTVICSGGWYPGKKEENAACIDLFDDTSNILLFDARGHGESEGRLFDKFCSYGLNEYQDIIGALDMISSLSTQPIILYGRCAGAFHCAHTLINLNKNNIYSSKYPIAGAIFDSIWSTVETTFKNAVTSRLKESIINKLSYIYRSETKQNLATTNSFKILYYAASTLFLTCTDYFLSPEVLSYQYKTELVDKIKTITVPTLFIHAYDDSYVHIHEAQQLAQEARDAHVWWIETSRHAHHHLLYHHEYKNRLTEFISYAVALKS